MLSAVLILLSTYETAYDKADQAWSGMVISENQMGLPSVCDA